MRIDDYCIAVSRDCRLSMTDRVVMWTMQKYVHRESGETFVSLATIAKDICVDTRTVRRAAHRLEGYGVFSSHARVGRSTVYRFPLHPALSTATPAKVDRGQISTTPVTTDRGGYPQPLSTQTHTPVNSGLDPCHVCPPNSCNHVQEPPRAADLGDDAPVAVPASVKDSLRPLPRMLYEAAQ